MDFITPILSQPLSALSVVALGLVIFFQLAQMGIINIKIGKTDKNRYQHWSNEAKAEQRIDGIMADVNELKDDVRNIKENHLAHIQEDMARIREDIAFIKGRFIK